ncbi:hemerythrin domain-containing protein [Geomonas sp. Red32]|uniref:hemerythrin domain-containing protein n=1 Tax=Geomonas sp. Red32 TaxID=2912856 RepID=UPI00202CBDD9|nr:hemerythrin domain-containing protein [Geomonas sp. Red32]MCM0080740.1 hemerythrin domain-containing protein [Geomonas sp. Red32]
MPTHEKTGEKGSSERNILDLLKQDHEKTRYLFDRIEKSGRNATASLQKLYAELEEEISLHLEGEERFFYTALEKHEEAREKVLESYEEHEVVKTMIGTFKGLAVDDERWGAKLKVLHEIVEHHLKEEESEVFKLARKALEKNEMVEIAVNFMRSKREGRKPSRGAPVEG